MPASKMDKLSTFSGWTFKRSAWAFIFLLLIGWLVASAQQNNPQQQVDPTIQVSINNLLDEKNPRAQRITMAQALLDTPQAHPMLVEILNKDGNLSAKIIICEVIAAGPYQMHPFKKNLKIPQSLINALFNALQNDNSDLALKAAEALARCYNGIPERLVEIAHDQSQLPYHRLAAIAALEQIPGKEPVIALLELLKDENQNIKDRAALALVHSLNLVPPADLSDFAEPNLALFVNADEQAFLIWQMDQKNQQLKHALTEIERQKQRADYWLDEFLKAKAGEFKNLKDPQDRLDFLKIYLTASSEDDLCVWAVGQIQDWCTPATAPPGDIIQSLVDLLRPFITADNPQLRGQTAATLEVLIEKAKPIAPELLEQLKNEPDPQVQAAILATLGAFEYTPSADQALWLLQSTQETVVAQAARTLGIISEAQTSPLLPDMINKIIPALYQCYQSHLEVPGIRHELLFAVKKIAAQQNYRVLVSGPFDSILRAALEDTSATLRRDAIDALTEIYREDVLTLLLEKNLLNDPETAVRLDVINTIEKYPRPEMLDHLRQRLAQESFSDVAKAIRLAFETILEKLPMLDSYEWAVKLKDSPNQDEQLLFFVVVEILNQKIIKAREAGQEVKVEYEKLIWLHQIKIARDENRTVQVLSNSYALLKLEIPEAEKDIYRRDIITFVLWQEDQSLLSRGREALQQLLGRPGAEEVLKIIETACDQLQRDDKLLKAARIITDLIMPLQEQLPLPQFRQGWDGQRRNVALKIIAAQRHLLTADNPQHDPQAIQLLFRLESRLRDFPADESPENRLAWLKAAEELLIKQLYPYLGYRIKDVGVRREKLKVKSRITDLRREVVEYMSRWVYEYMSV